LGSIDALVVAWSGRPVSFKAARDGVGCHCVLVTGVQETRDRSGAKVVDRVVVVTKVGERLGHRVRIRRRVAGHPFGDVTNAGIPVGQDKSGS